MLTIYSFINYLSQNRDVKIILMPHAIIISVFAMIYKDIYNFFGLTVDNIFEKVKAFINR